MYIVQCSYFSGEYKIAHVQFSTKTYISYTLSVYTVDGDISTRVRIRLRRASMPATQRLRVQNFPFYCLAHMFRLHTDTAEE